LFSPTTDSKKVNLLYGKTGITLTVPESADVLEGEHVTPINNPEAELLKAFNNPISSQPLEKLLTIRKPKTVAVTISDITRPVPNKKILPPLLQTLNKAGISDSQIVIIIGTGMHRTSTPQERESLLGKDILERIEIIDHTADKPETLVKVCDVPPVYVCRRFVEADFKIVTGFIEPHFMAGFSGGRKGVCPALVDLRTVQRFHGYETLSNPNAASGILNANPCHKIASEVAKIVGVDFLVNVGLTREKKIAGIYCGNIEKAHLTGCQQVAKWTTAYVEKSYDLVITNGGGYPLDESFYQATKGICGALPALTEDSTLLVVSRCGEKLGSKIFTDTMLKYDNDWRKFLSDISSAEKTILDQWGYHMHTRVLERIGLEKLLFVSDGIPQEMQKHISVTPVLGNGNASQRAQTAIDQFLSTHNNPRIAVIPEGPYTMLCNKKNSN